jgi:ribosome modulation factor
MEECKKAREDGFRAAEAGSSTKTCPYPEGNNYRAWWVCGFDKYYSDRLRDRDVPYPFYYY